MHQAIYGNVPRFSLQAGLSLAKGHPVQAKRYIEHGLKKEPYNLELLQNMCVIASITKDTQEEIRSFALLKLLGGQFAGDL